MDLLGRSAAWNNPPVAVVWLTVRIVPFHRVVRALPVVCPFLVDRFAQPNVDATMTYAPDPNRAVRAYIALLVAGAVTVIALTIAAGKGGADRGSFTIASLLTAGILVAQWFPIHLTDKTKVYVDTTILIATVFLLPPDLAIDTVAVAIAAQELIARISWEQGNFNVAQSVVYIGAGACMFRAIADEGTGRDLIGGRALAAAGAGIVVMPLLNTPAVATIAALQLGKQVPWFWLEGIWIDLPEHAILAVNGLMLAIAAGSLPWLLPLLAGQLVLIYLSLRQSAELRATTCTILQAIADLNQLLARDPAGVVRTGHKQARKSITLGFARRYAEIRDRDADTARTVAGFASRDLPAAGVTRSPAGPTVDRPASATARGMARHDIPAGGRGTVARHPVRRHFPRHRRRPCSRRRLGRCCQIFARGRFIAGVVPKSQRERQRDGEGRSTTLPELG